MLEIDKSRKRHGSSLGSIIWFVFHIGSRLVLRRKQGARENVISLEQYYLVLLQCSL